MNHPACSAPDIESRTIGMGPAVFMCVFHLIAGVIAAFLAIGLLAAFGGFR